MSRPNERQFNISPPLTPQRVQFSPLILVVASFFDLPVHTSCTRRLLSN
jgi:hypothetical protein